MHTQNELEVWGGLECTINRVGDQYMDQSEYSGHYRRGESDIDLIASLGVSMLRYPVLWEKHLPQSPDQDIDWTFVTKTLNRMREKGVTPIAGLVHHGSGPAYVNFFDGSFEQGLAAYATKVAEKFPWLEYFTPVNEPLTTARFCGLYGHWYPHGKDNFTFFKVLLSECKATVMAMQSIRKIIPHAKLIQTEDLGKCHSTPLLQYQADMENERRWLSYELLCGTLTPDKLMWQIMVETGIAEEELSYFLDNNCRPHVAGFNYYLTSERYLDEDQGKYPECYHGGNTGNGGGHTYADIEIVKVKLPYESGPQVLLKEAWERLKLPMAITECHLHCTREEQMRWFHTMWKHLKALKEDGVDIRAITAWAIFGLYGWNQLVTKPWGDYEPGVFNLSSGCPRPTALARFLQELTRHKVYYHPVLENEGWWMRESRPVFNKTKVVQMNPKKEKAGCRPLVILGKSGTLGAAFSRICEERNIHHLLLSRSDLDVTKREEMEAVLAELKPWGVINAAGFENVDEAEHAEQACMEANCYGPAILADLCRQHSIRFLSFSTDLVFDGAQQEPYTESAPVAPVNRYGLSKVKAEEAILAANGEALVVRTSSFFGPWDTRNFVAKTLSELKQGHTVTAASDVTVSPTYVPDLVHHSLDLLLDHETGIVHLVNEGAVTWAELGRKVAELSGCDASLIKAVPVGRIKLGAKRPRYSVLKSEKGIRLPSLDAALERYFDKVGNVYLSDKIAV